MLKINFYLVIIFSWMGTLFCQEIPLEFFKYKIIELQIDAGRNWIQNSNLGSRRFFENIENQ